MKVLLASSEAIPYAKTGGLADVSGSLVNELRSIKVNARLIMPMHRGIKSRFKPDYTEHDIKVSLGKKKYTASLFVKEESTIFIRCNEFFDRSGIYGNSQGPYDDNDLRFIFFSKAVLEACKVLRFIPDVIHCNDWHTALIPLYIRTIYKGDFGNSASLLTIHNLGYQGIFPGSAMTITGLGQEMFAPEVIEFYGQVNVLKAGITSADAISTVSPNYAREILDEGMGFGLDGVLKDRAGDLTGIINGIDYAEWDPSRDMSIPEAYDSADMSGKKKCRDYLIKKCGFKKGKLPLLSVVGRLASQKGLDILLDAADSIFSYGANLVVLGTGEEDIANRLKELKKKYPENVSVNICFDEGLAHLIYAGSDMILIPSRYEPCGLSQMIGMRYGTVPVARSTGGLKDSIEDFNVLKRIGTGFLFKDYKASALEECIKRAICVCANKETWGKLMANCMREDFSWKASAKKYEALYRRLLKKAEK
jgi:starch synthase